MIAVSEFVAMVMVPDLIRILRQEVPLIDLVIRPDSRIDLAEQIDLGQIDAAVGTFPGVPPRFRLDPLFTYNDVLIAKPSLELGKPSVQKLSDLSIAVISFAWRTRGGRRRLRIRAWTGSTIGNV